MSRISLQSIVGEAPIIAIVRLPGVDPVRCSEQLFQAGIRLIEITIKDEFDRCAEMAERLLEVARSGRASR